MTAEEEIIFTIQQACGVLGGPPLDVAQHKAYAQEFIAELATRLPEKDEGTDAKIAAEIMMELVKSKGPAERILRSHESYANLFAKKFAGILRAELNKA
ncbi:hypothetical protein FAI41_06640 [Acetobacteraceae bacterium]|nr:hypothetical protein FAI41_06640 [Acetobacteraceae bacterium]